MADNNRKNEKLSGIFLLIAGIFGLISKFSNNNLEWDMVGIIKTAVPIILILAGIWFILRPKKKK